MLNVLDKKMKVSDAIAYPRLHHQWYPNMIYLEPNLPAKIIQELLKRKHTIRTYPSTPGHAQAIECTATGWRGACDPRKGGRPSGR